MKIQDKNLDSYFVHISVLLDAQANLPEISPFFVCPNSFGGHFFQIFIVLLLGMYNFGLVLEIGAPLLTKSKQHSKLIPFAIVT